MKALVFAAGLGERMRPLTDTTPKPLLPVRGKPLIVWHLEKLAALGIRDVIVNTSWLAERFPDTLGDGAHWDLRIHYAYEGPTPLETGGGLLHALSILAGADGNDAFVAINGDIWTDYDFARLPRAPSGDAHLVLVDNPVHHPGGDFTLLDDGRVASGSPHADGMEPGAGQRLTFAGLGVYRPGLLADWRTVIGDADGTGGQPPRFKLAPLLRAAMAGGRVGGERHAGAWTDVGTPARLAQLNDVGATLP